MPDVARRGASRNSGYARNADDWYIEPVWSVQALLDAEPFWGRVWDPACGSGTIPKVCAANGLDTMATDLRDRGYGLPDIDFLAHQTAGFDAIVTNPPYNLASEFALKALSYFTQSKVPRAPMKLAMFVRLGFLEGQARHALLFDPHPPSRVLVFRRRVSCPPGGMDVKPGNGSVAYCWVIWNSHYPSGPTQIDWI